MFTLVQRPQNDYDIDTAIIFREEALPANALDARKRVADALLASGASFKQPPAPRTNAVTVWYAEGFHIDLAVYRERRSRGRIVIEHAGSQWTERDPEAIPRWFRNCSRHRSPKEAATESGLRDYQMRRFVRYLKAFVCSHDSSGLPGGLLITALVGECYHPQPSRDDKALYDTMAAIADYLRKDLRIYSPVDRQTLLTTKTKHYNQAQRFQALIEDALKQLDSLWEQSCNEAVAMEAWDWIFRHEYWSQRKIEANSALAHGIKPLWLEVGVFRKRAGPTSYIYNTERGFVRKNRWMCFRIENFNPTRWQQVYWIVGDRTFEAREYWLRALGRGRQTVACEVWESGSRIARGEVTVWIGDS